MVNQIDPSLRRGLEGLGAQPSTPAGPPAGPPEGTPTGLTGNILDFIIGQIPTIPGEAARAGISARDYAYTQFYLSMPDEWMAAWRDAGGGDPLAERRLAYEETELGYKEAKLGLDIEKLFSGGAGDPLSSLEQTIALGLLPYNIEMDEFKRQREYWRDKVEAQEVEADYAVSKFNAWLGGQIEAGKRAEEETKIRGRTFASPYFPQTEPTGMLAKVAEGYDLPFEPFRGVPYSQVDPERVYGEWASRMGMEQTAPTIPTVNVEQPPQPPAVGGQAVGWVRSLLQGAGMGAP